MDKITDMTFYQIENLVADLRFQLDLANGKIKMLEADVVTLQTGEELVKLNRKVAELGRKVRDWRNMAHDLHGELLQAQQMLDRYQIGISGSVNQVLSRFEALRDVR